LHNHANVLVIDDRAPSSASPPGPNHRGEARTYPSPPPGPASSTPCFMTPEPHLRGHVAFHAASASRERGRPDVRIVGELAHVTYRRPSARRNGGRPADPPSVPPPAALYSAISSSTV